jgi:dCTP diphosphatase
VFAACFATRGHTTVPHLTGGLPSYTRLVRLAMDAEKSLGTPCSPLMLEDLRQRIHAFAAEREWETFHTPRNLVLALVGEVGELAEIFQWRGDSGSPPNLAGWTAKDREHLGEELSDVLIYLVRLSDRCGVDLSAAAVAKLAKNAAKYPAGQSKGRSDKYTAYSGSASAEAESTLSAHPRTPTVGTPTVGGRDIWPLATAAGLGFCVASFAAFVILGLERRR